MCPQRLFTNTELFMNAGKRNPTRARSGPDLAGGAGAGAPRGGRLFFRSVRDRAAVRPGRGAARRGRSVRLGLQPRRLCLLGAEGLRPRPCGARMDLAPPAFPGLRRALSSPPPSGPIPLSCPQPWLRENSVSKIFTSGAAVSDKKLPVSTTRRLQPTTDFNFLPLNTSPPDSDLPSWLSRRSSTSRVETSHLRAGLAARLARSRIFFPPLPPAETSQKTPPAVYWKMSSPKSR
ncbi:uncharacterized protein LOC141571557 [Rhinolophus sinicus]|uniref:uncharacterized protein LOC141571557 n=1 Tax=Rhinolophus sinicus TaxID=89399 RepID=UPI003D7B287E